MSVKVWQSHRCKFDSDWEMACTEHNEAVTAFSWTSAMEAAWGHVVMHHGEAS